MVKVPLYLEAGRQWLAENALPPPPLEMREYRPFEDDNAIPVLVCTHCGKGTPANAFCNCIAGMAASKLFDATSRRPIEMKESVFTSKKHAFSRLSDRCMMCGMTRQAATDDGIAACTPDGINNNLARLNASFQTEVDATMLAVPAYRDLILDGRIVLLPDINKAWEEIVECGFENRHDPSDPVDPVDYEVMRLIPKTFRPEMAAEGVEIVSSQTPGEAIERLKSALQGHLTDVLTQLAMTDHNQRLFILWRKRPNVFQEKIAGIKTGFCAYARFVAMWGDRKFASGVVERLQNGPGSDDLVAAMNDAVNRNDWDRAAAIRTEALKRSGKSTREQMERKAAKLFNLIPDLNNLHATWDAEKARHRAEKRSANVPPPCQQPPETFQRQRAAIAAAFALPPPGAGTIDTLSASPPACKLLPGSG